MSVSDAVPRQFRDDFVLVARHYDLSEEELADAKAAALADLDAAVVTFCALADEVRARKALMTHEDSLPSVQAEGISAINQSCTRLRSDASTPTHHATHQPAEKLP